MKRLAKWMMIVMLLFVVIGCGVADGSRITAKDVLDQTPSADILQYEDRVFNNMTDVDSFQTEKANYEKHHLLGEIKLQTNKAKEFASLVASKLPEGTKVYATGEQYFGVLIVEFQGEDLYYQELIDG